MINVKYSSCLVVEQISVHCCITEDRDYHVLTDLEHCKVIKTI